jgi:hypothetical protein
MTATELELAAVLDHCRNLVDAADRLAHVGRERDRRYEVAVRQWAGPHRQSFDARYRQESADLSTRIWGLRSEADAWAVVWADEVNRINQRRRDAAVDLVSAGRGLGESFVDLFVGDDSSHQVRAYHPVAVPTAANRFVATGGLESF